VGGRICKYFTAGSWHKNEKSVGGGGLRQGFAAMDDNDDDDDENDDDDDVDHKSLESSLQEPIE